MPFPIEGEHDVLGMACRLVEEGLDADSATYVAGRIADEVSTRQSPQAVVMERGFFKGGGLAVASSPEEITYYKKQGFKIKGKL